MFNLLNRLYIYLFCLSSIFNKKIYIFFDFLFNMLYNIDISIDRRFRNVFRRNY
nr:MAG TPA: hypothetical protein [Caudoviricetes sp.]